MDIKNLLILFMIFALIALPITVYLTYLDFNHSGDSFCDIDDTFSCSTVSESKYSRFLGVPVAVLGFLTYLFLFIMAFGVYRGWSFNRINKNLKREHILYILAFVSGFGTVFSLYLTYAEFFWIKAFCVLCLTQQGLIMMLFFLSLTAALFNKEMRLK